MKQIGFINVLFFTKQIAGASCILLWNNSTNGSPTAVYAFQKSNFQQSINWFPKKTHSSEKNRLRRTRDFYTSGFLKSCPAVQIYTLGLGLQRAAQTEWRPRLIRFLRNKKNFKKNVEKKKTKTEHRDHASV